MNRLKVLAGAAVAVAAIGGLAVGTLPGHPGATSLVPVATSLDAAGLYNQAQQNFAAGDAKGGLELLSQVLAIAPADADAIALQAIWSDQVDDATTMQSALNRLTLLRPTLARGARDVIAGVATAAAIVPDTSPKNVSGGPAIVVLGYGLRPDGSMAPELVRRVMAAQAQAELLGSARIVVTGGVPKNGVTEAAAMQKWLVDNGIESSRITMEDRSTSTVSNAQNTATLLRGTGVRDVLLVTSPNHIRRAAADFGAVGLRVVATLTTETELSKYATPLTKDRQSGIRLEATRAAGIPATHTPGVLPENLPDTGPGLIPEIGGRLLEELLGTGSAGQAPE